AYVSGLASLLLAQDPSRTPAMLRSIIQETADDQVGKPAEDTPGWDRYHGHGRVNAFRALSKSGASIRIVSARGRALNRTGVIFSGSLSAGAFREPGRVTRLWDVRGKNLGRLEYGQTPGMSDPRALAQPGRGGPVLYSTEAQRP